MNENGVAQETSLMEWHSVIATRVRSVRRTMIPHRSPPFPEYPSFSPRRVQFFGVLHTCAKFCLRQPLRILLRIFVQGGTTVTTRTLCHATVSPLPERCTRTNLSC